MMLGQFWLSVRTSFVAVTKPHCAIMRSFSALEFWQAQERSESKSLPLLKGFRRRNSPQLPPHLLPYAERRMEIKV